ncbi:unnamed protein product [Ectocarpus sp. 12 AP-2014]
MQHDRTVLGWAKKSTRCPGSVTRLAAGGTDLLLIDVTEAKTARARLELQVMCFETGIDFVPTAPAQLFPEPAGVSRAITQEREIAAMLDHFEGKGQLRLEIADAPVPTAQTAAASGRDWLTRRKALYDTRIARKLRAKDVLDHLDLAEFDIKTRALATGVERDILVPKKALKRVLKHLRTSAEKIDTAMTLSVTGLWPPFSFVQPFCDSRTTWD